MLQFESGWRFASPGPAPRAVVNAFYSFIEKIASQGDGWGIAERFKSQFGGGSCSSNESWAWSDLNDCMQRAAENAPLFIEAFYDGCVACANEAIAVPDLPLVNRVLMEHDAGYEIRPPLLVATRSYTAIAVPQKTPSLAEQARLLIEESLAASERLMDEGQGRRAVQEILWLLETIATAFRGTGPEDATVQGKYFVTIVKEMKAHGRGKAQEQILNWMTTLHGYLSSPTGGGVRHGVDLKSGIAIQTHEARLYCNLIRSYITYMIEEHEHRTSPSKD
ncbi:hypothetical protein [Azospirillum sp. TSO5]|uniref:hypothetical protein n=1 Tax=Azospirillum sp. TSO5 TaxID=716760 RepID=UPI000D6165E9|nr:hypothetical protein [Azospirillum sp. TSO5]PWC93002.1 hypothetical protein TSO5_16405 [Azospirillum sp. TSO5]